MTDHEKNQILVDVLNAIGIRRLMIALIEDKDFNFYYTEVLIHDKDDESVLYVEPLTLIRKRGDENRDSILFSIERNEQSETMMGDPIDVFGALCTYKGEKYTICIVQHMDDAMGNQLLNIEILRSWVSFSGMKTAEDIMSFVISSENKYGTLTEDEMDAYFESKNKDGEGFDAVFGFYETDDN